MLKIKIAFSIQGFCLEIHHGPKLHIFNGFIYNSFCNHLLHATCSILWNQLTNYKVLNWPYPDPSENKIPTALLIWQSNLENRKGRQQTCFSGRHQGTFSTNLEPACFLRYLNDVINASDCLVEHGWQVVFIGKWNMRLKRVLDIRIQDKNPGNKWDLYSACALLAPVCLWLVQSHLLIKSIMCGSRRPMNLPETSLSAARTACTRTTLVLQAPAWWKEIFQK